MATRGREADGGLRRADGRWSSLLADAALALVLLLVGYVGTRAAAQNFPHAAPVDGWADLLVTVAALALVVRRRWPLVTLAFGTVAASAYLVAGYPYGPILFSFFVAVYTVARHLPIRRAVLGCTPALAAVLVHVFVSLREPVGLSGLLPGAAWIVVPFAVGVTVRNNREAAARDRIEQARRLADDERLRIAQEVHDVVGHGLAAINMQAEIALHLLAKRPEQAETALTAISRTSREALDELRVTLSVVRRDAAVDRAPVPGLDQVAALTARLRQTGLTVTLECEGDRRPLPVAVDLAAYRVVQESLTNVLRHAGTAAATVRIGYLPDEVTVEVVDTGHGGSGAAGPGEGHGLTGMRERIDALGGALEVGPRPGGGFRVFARLPARARD
ncbi:MULTISPECIES: sensor histidine kinase [unclassified Plantactinospora]|uniref:sensor histidine kinase n=1 Tax=unclassified Plantactinospora TaxID=2631981 RepID=UPI000D15D9D5|nr:MULTISPECIES: sensor histidine kinase [unclassified Plantactinospora]AVT30802.1 two-component sensor histidine kinase [Plantactinospora sp. BC1]AVT37373.1 two-component sensor histidine kinase [Plantactinospora sp. BB1]